MSRSRILSKLIIPIALLTIYSIALYKTATAPEESSLIEERVTQTRASTQALVEEENTSDLPRPPKAPPAPTAALNSPEKLRFVALTDPRMVPAAQANWLTQDDMVLGIIHDGEAQAFPLQQIALHHVINTRIAGESFVIAYCVLCGGQAASYQATIDGSRFTFDIFGIYKGDLALIDRQTGSVWAVKNGDLLGGPLSAQEKSLKPQILAQGTWDEWRSLHPNTTVLPQLPEYLIQYSQFKFRSEDLTSPWVNLIYTDERLSREETVLGISHNSQYEAYEITEAGLGLSVATDNLGGMPIAIFFDGDQDKGAAYLATINDQDLNFFVENGKIFDESGSTWDIEGRAISGSLRGNELTSIAYMLTQWDTWSAYHPETRIFGQ